MDRAINIHTWLSQGGFPLADIIAICFVYWLIQKFYSKDSADENISIFIGIWMYLRFFFYKEFTTILGTVITFGSIFIAHKLTVLNQEKEKIASEITNLLKKHEKELNDRESIAHRLYLKFHDYIFEILGVYRTAEKLIQDCDFQNFKEKILPTLLRTDINNSAEVEEFFLKPYKESSKTLEKFLKNSGEFSEDEKEELYQDYFDRLKNALLIEIDEALFGLQELKQELGPSPDQLTIKTYDLFSSTIRSLRNIKSHMLNGLYSKQIVKKAIENIVNSSTLTLQTIVDAHANSTKIISKHENSIFKDIGIILKPKE